MSSILRCWCGNQNLELFSNEYFRCPLCETLIAAHIPDPEQLLVGQDERGLYGRSYFESYRREPLHGCLGATTRSLVGGLRAHHSGSIAED